MSGVSLRAVTKRWGDVVAVDAQSLEVRDREFLVLLGPSGCGKTTTMRMIAGLERPTSGEIWIGGRMVNDDLPRDRDIAMVFQNYGLYPHMTVFDNISYPLRVRGVSRREIGGRVRAAAEQVALGELLERRPRALSGGQRQRVALARAIVRRPQVFLMDEPLSNLDAKLRVSMRAELRHLSRRLRTTTVYVTHDQVEAMTLADRVAVMADGVIRQLGTPSEVYDDPADLFVAGFIGSPGMNLLEGSVRGGCFVPGDGVAPDDGGVAPERGDFALACDDMEGVVLGVRPEDIEVCAAGGGVADGEVYACENTGDSSLLTVELFGRRVVARGDRHLRRESGERVGLGFSREHVRLFSAESGRRLRL
ncbi:MAG: sn-glycerol-3-phosphate ABC transporter ATP-binding protein UgpC [Alphaproteobacteria bacterium]|nr:sn-glycerol-3-phosphate ABC transporter ATP-binding protein UgpC [Alphaproteobacteria bacterium]MDA8004501.1 sn-glycerol-3-phosphate ABC transporter ATP-binding protein UgpC [Alphaproteobacteria bacterium]MDA8006360.1 sn-glycerol-3-phosphate ABC transporter ATP-binding protein UgpC [Alphaproteobacteria bacterium]MDA8013732.1 sn-glycerol-3-phosphate ABC transporter ATP-binding protein UgpC [Alphaproteobacteria bacterium]